MYPYDYAYYDYYNPTYDYESDNYVVNFQKPKRPSIFKRILNKIPILRDRQDVITPFIGPILAGIFVAAAAATASSPPKVLHNWPWSFQSWGDN